MNSAAKDPALSGLFAGQSLELSDESKRKPSFILTPKNAQGFWVSEDRGVLLGRKLSLLGRSQDWIKILGVGVSLVKLRQEFETSLLSQVAGLDKSSLSLILQKTYLTHRPCLRKGRQLVLWVEKNLESAVFDSIKLAIQQWNESHEKPEKIEVESLDKIPRGPTGKVLQSL
jgi:acyl-CoA synthetase (AMP-forming)/AMP-acid ligase II